AEMSIVPIELDAKSVVAIVDGASRGDLYFVVPRGFTTGCTKQDSFGYAFGLTTSISWFLI
ncbi:hypothetical protein Tco_0070409, partial [Tanacetum coccineum]